MHKGAIISLTTDSVNISEGLPTEPVCFSVSGMLDRFVTVTLKVFEGKT